MKKTLTQFKPIVLALGIAFTISGLTDHHQLDYQRSQTKQWQTRYSDLTTSLQKALNTNTSVRSQLKQKDASEASLKAQIQDLQTKLQSKIEEQNRIASVPTGYGGGNYTTSAPTNFAGGYPNGYAFGNCTWFVASLVHVPNDWGNASNWANAARSEGYTVSDVPQIGSIAQTSAGYFGHVALVEAIGDGTVTVKEMNVQGLDVIDEQAYPTSYFVYIYP